MYKFNGTPANVVSNKDKIFFSKFWCEFFKLLGTKLKMSSAYHPQTNGQTKVVNRSLETYLRCMVEERPKNWSKWVPLAEWWYNTSFHSSIQTTPYQVVYEQLAPAHLPYLPGYSKVEAIDRSMQTREAIIKFLKFHSARAQ